MRVSVVVVAVALAARTVHADSPPPQAPEEPVLVESYRATTLVMDGVAVVLVAAGEDSSLIGIPLYVLGPPIVHMTKGRPGRAVASLAMRVGLPLLGVVIGDSIPQDCGPTGDCMTAPSMNVVIGLGTGIVAASALDAIFLARGDEPSAKLKTSWQPVAHSTRGGFALGIAGQF
jgi:hypothetical protein